MSFPFLSFEETKNERETLYLFNIVFAIVAAGAIGIACSRRCGNNKWMIREVRNSLSVIRFESLSKGHPGSYLKLATTFTLAALLSWVYCMYIFFVYPLRCCRSNDVARQETKKNDETKKKGKQGKTFRKLDSKPFDPSAFELKDTEYEVSYVAAPIQMSGVLREVINSEGIHHVGVLFRGRSQTFVLDMCACAGMFAAISPQISVGLSLVPPKPVLALEWNNGADVMLYSQYDADYWMTTVRLGIASRDEMKNLFDWVASYKRRFSRYSLWSVRGPSEHVFFEDRTCEVFVFSLIRFLHNEGTPFENLKQLHPRSVCAMYVGDIVNKEPTTSSFQTELVVDFFRSWAAQIKNELAVWMSREFSNVASSSKNADKDGAAKSNPLTMGAFFSKIASILERSVFTKRSCFCYALTPEGKAVYVHVKNVKVHVSHETIVEFLRRKALDPVGR